MYKNRRPVELAAVQNGCNRAIHGESIITSYIPNVQDVMSFFEYEAIFRTFHGQKCETVTLLFIYFKALFEYAARNAQFAASLLQTC